MTGWRAWDYFQFLLLFLAFSCSPEAIPPLEIEISEQAEIGFDSILAKSWSFTYDLPDGTQFAPERMEARLSEPRRQAGTCAGGMYVVRVPVLPDFPSSFLRFTPGVLSFLTVDGKANSGQGMTTNLPDRGRIGGAGDALLVFPPNEESEYFFRSYGFASERGSDREFLAMLESSDLVNWSPIKRISNGSAWTLTAALTPGGRHVRLYLETEGKIKTLISEKDNFVKFHSESSPRFLDLTTSRPLDIRPRNPNVTVNDAGVFAMTWDNRDPRIGPDHPNDTTELSDFGLAFSVDGLNWTVWGNGLGIDGLGREGKLGSECAATYYNAVRHVVPVFITNDQIRLYFTYGSSKSGRGSACYGFSCSLGTAISN